ncbi:MAG TPA: hypothetical protein V6D20_22455 [Candidatus Obscuribacterales bacterium]
MRLNVQRGLGWCLASLIGGLGACGEPSDVPPELPPVPEVPPEDEPADDGNQPTSFDPQAVQVGDRIAGLELTGLEVMFHGDNNQIISGWAEFEGTTTVSGIYDPEFLFPGALEGTPCFNVDETRSSLPRFDFDERRLWFCFSNPEAAIAAFPGATDEIDATIAIANYRIDYAPSDVVNTAEFVQREE